MIDISGAEFVLFLCLFVLFGFCFFVVVLGFFGGVFLLFLFLEIVYVCMRACVRAFQPRRGSFYAFG